MEETAFLRRKRQHTIALASRPVGLDMKLNRAAHIPWALLVLALSAFATLLYLAAFHPQRVPANLRFFGETPPGPATIGGHPLGLALGTLAFGVFLFAALLGARKRMPRLFPGHIQTWLRAHIWLTVLTIPLILLHSGFRLGSPMTTLLMVLYAVVMLSGFYGLFLQQKLPAWMKDTLPAELVYEQIPNVRAQLMTAALRLQRALKVERVQIAPALPGPAMSAPARELSVSPETSPEAEKADRASEELLLQFIERDLLPYLEARRGEKLRLGHQRESDDTFRYLGLRVSAPYRGRVEEMRAWCDERRRLDLQVRMHHWLHGWLFVHAPLSFLLLLFTAWHAFVTLFRY